MKRNIIYFFWAIMTLWTASACVRELPIIDDVGDSYDGQKVTVTFSVPALGMMPATRATDENDVIGEDVKLNSLHLAVFGSSGFLKEYVKAKELGPATEGEENLYVDVDSEGNIVYENGRPKTFNQTEYNTRRGNNDKKYYPALTKYSVTLTCSDKQRTIHFIGNGPESIPFGDSTILVPLLSANDGGQAPGQAFWQMKRVDNIGADLVDGNYIPTEYLRESLSFIPLVRNWAKITIEANTDNGNDPYFDPICFAVVNAPSKGTIVPVFQDQKDGKSYWHFLENYQKYQFRHLNGDEAYEGEPLFTYPGNLPTDVTFDETPPDHTSFDQEPYTKGVVAANEAVYLYERPIPTQQLKPTFIIVYGTFRHEHDHVWMDEHPRNNWVNGHPTDDPLVGDYYYKIDLAQMDANGEVEYFPVYRNFQYKIKINKIEAIGHSTPEAAAKSAGSANISSDVNTRHLGDISDGVARLAVQPWMTKVFHEKQTGNKDLFVKFFDRLEEDPNMRWTTGGVEYRITKEGKFYKKVGDSETEIPESDAPKVSDQNPVASTNPVGWELEQGKDDLITDVKIGRPDKEGWRNIEFSTAERGTKALTQTLKIRGVYSYEISPGTTSTRELYREIDITLLPAQPMMLHCTSPVDDIGSQVQLDISIPDGLDKSLFPIDFAIEPTERTLMPDFTQNALPVISDDPLSPKLQQGTTKTYQFVRTLTWDEYDHCDKWVNPDDDEEVWRKFSSYFITTRSESATTIYVGNKFFDTNSTEFKNFKRFRPLAFENYIKLETNWEVPVTFNVEEDGPLPELTLVAKGMTTNDASCIESTGGITKYVYTPTASGQQRIVFKSTVDDGKVSLTLSDEKSEYIPATLEPFEFTECRFLDGRSYSSGHSNVVLEYLNSATNNEKLAPFGYCDNPALPVANEDLTVRDFDGEDVYQGLTRPDAITNFTSNLSYHEILFKTKTSGAYAGVAPIKFRLTAPGYIEKKITAGRFKSANIGNYNNTKPTRSDFKSAANLNKFLSQDGFTFDNEKGAFSIRFNKISSISSAGLNLDPSTLESGEKFELTVESKNAFKLFYIEITFAEQNQPEVMPTCNNVGNSRIEKFKGAKNKYVWTLNPSLIQSNPPTVNDLPKTVVFTLDGTTSMTIELINVKSFENTGVFVSP